MIIINFIPKLVFRLCVRMCIMYLVNVSPPQPLDVATSNRSHDAKGTKQHFCSLCYSRIYFFSFFFYFSESWSKMTISIEINNGLPIPLMCHLFMILPLNICYHPPGPAPAPDNKLPTSGSTATTCNRTIPSVTKVHTSKIV